MEIAEIKSRLPLSQVLKHYGLKPDKNLRLRCPFHDDRTPSLQVYYKTHTCYCFSTNCRTHGRAMDVIDFILHKEGCTKHEAILKAKAMVEGEAVATPQSGAGEPGRENGDERTALLEQVFTYFKNGVHNSKPAKEYLAGRCLDYTKTEVGYNSGQFHHGKRKDEALIRACVEHGILLDLGTKSRTGNPAYKPFGKWCVVFPLRDEAYRITGLYFRSTLEKKNQRHFYLKNRQGLYPHYPNKDTKKLILTESIIDAASLLEHCLSRSSGNEIKGKYGVLALYGTNGLTEEHQRAIREWLGPPTRETSSDGASSSLGSLGRKSHLGSSEHELIFFLNGDEAGRSAVAKYAPMLKAEYPNLKITNVQVPENEDVNSLLQGHSAEILVHLIKTRKEYDLLLSTEKSNEKEKVDLPSEPEAIEEAPKKIMQNGLDTNASAGLDASNPYNLKYTGTEARYQIKGFKTSQLDSLKITLKILKR